MFRPLRGLFPREKNARLKAAATKAQLPAAEVLFVEMDLGHIGV
jgi:hypothetical protein